MSSAPADDHRDSGPREPRSNQGERRDRFAGPEPCARLTKSPGTGVSIARPSLARPSAQRLALSRAESLAPLPSTCSGPLRAKSSLDERLVERGYVVKADCRQACVPSSALNPAFLAPCFTRRERPYRPARVCTAIGLRLQSRVPGLESFGHLGSD